MRRIVALDLGSSTGVATWDGHCVHAETLLLASDKQLREAKKLRMDRRLDIRAARFAHYLNSLFELPIQPQLFVYEDVLFQSSRAQTQLWGSFRGVLWAVATLRGAEVECLNTASLKKFASGNGSADKDQMAAALVRKHPDAYKLEKGLVRDGLAGTLLSDDAVDALHLLDFALQNLNK